MKKIYNAGAGRKIRKSIGMRDEDWKRLYAIMAKLDRGAGDVLARLVRLEHKKIFPT